MLLFFLKPHYRHDYFDRPAPSYAPEEDRKPKKKRKRRLVVKRIKNEIVAVPEFNTLAEELRERVKKRKKRSTALLLLKMMMDDD